MFIIAHTRRFLPFVRVFPRERSYLRFSHVCMCRWNELAVRPCAEQRERVALVLLRLQSSSVGSKEKEREADCVCMCTVISPFPNCTIRSEERERRERMKGKKRVGRRSSFHVDSISSTFSIFFSFLHMNGWTMDRPTNQHTQGSPFPNVTLDVSSSRRSSQLRPHSRPSV